MGIEEQTIAPDLVIRDVQNGVAVLTINNPPLAILSSDVRTALSSAVAFSLGDEAVDGIVITGTGSVFAAGAATSEVVEEGVVVGLHGGL